MTPDTINEINENLDELGADFSIGMTVEVPIEVSLNETTCESHLKMQVTENGYEIVDRKEQLRRVAKEAREAELSS
jgi:hypothetical protein